MNIYLSRRRVLNFDASLGIGAESCFILFFFSVGMIKGLWKDLKLFIGKFGRIIA